MKHPRQSSRAFHPMTRPFRLRDRLRQHIKILQEAGVRSGMTVLDLGCGPGGFATAVAK